MLTTKHIKRLAALTLGLSLAACTVPVKRELVPVGGSKSDGIVYMSYEHGYMLDPQVDYGAAQAVASQVCIGWGYSGAARLGSSSRCRDRACSGYVVTVPYQCTGGSGTR